MRRIMIFFCVLIVWLYTSSVMAQSSSVASFTYDPTSGPAPLEVEFTDTSTGTVISWDWYDDGVWFSSEPNPTRTFNSTSVVELVINEGTEQVNEDYWLTAPFQVSGSFASADSGAFTQLTYPIDRVYPGAVGAIEDAVISATDGAIIYPHQATPSGWYLSSHNMVASCSGATTRKNLHYIPGTAYASELPALFSEYTNFTASVSGELHSTRINSSTTSMFIRLAGHSGCSQTTGITSTMRLIINSSIQPYPNESSHAELVIVEGSEADLVRPFAAIDEGASFGNPVTLVEGYSFADTSFFSHNAKSVTAFSNKHATVYAADDGTVISISPLTSQKCNSQDSECYVVFDDVDLFGIEDLSVDATALMFNLTSVYVVTIQAEANRHLRYLVTNPYQYIAVGEAVGKGCPIGESVTVSERYAGMSSVIGPVAQWLIQTLLTLSGVNVSSIKPLFPPQGAEFTLVHQTITISGTTHIVPLLPSLIEYPEDEPRACEYQPSACLSADPQLKRPELWASTGLVEWFSGGGAVLNPGSRIDMQLTLNNEENYIIEVWARSFSNATGRFSTQLGQTLVTFTTGYTFQQFIIPSGLHAPDLGLFYTLSVANVGSEPLLIQSVCVRDENNGSSRPGTCYFNNFSFDGLPAAQGWNTTGTVNDGVIPGEIIMYDGDTISQNARLFPDGASPHVYFVTVTATVGGADITTLKADSASDVGFEFEYPASNGFEDFFAPNSGDMYPVSGFFTGVDNGITFLPDNQIVFWGNVTVSSFENSTFTIKAVIDSSNPNLFVRVREVCIDDPFDHHDDPDAWIPPAPFGPNCVGISPPQDDLIGTWIYYHWAQLDRFFQCDLMVLLNRMHDTAQKAYLLIGWEFRYWQSTALMFTRWLSSDVIHWLNGHFRNMAVGSVTTIESAPGATLWDVLLALINVVLGPIVEAIREIITMLLGIISQAVSLLFTVMTAIITFVLGLLIQIINLLGLAQSLLGTIVTAYNTAEPVTLPGMANCTVDPQATPWCISMWILSNTIFSGAGTAIIPLLTGIGSIHLILYVAGEIRRAIMQVGQTA